MVKKDIEKVIKKALKGSRVPDFVIEEPREKKFGDYSTNVALLLKEVSAESLVKKIDSKMFKKIEIAGPGFINFFLSDDYLQKKLKRSLKKDFGKLNIGKKKKINMEFISANPTGPLTLGNGRGGFGGDVLSNVLEKSGFDVTREFYINDRGKQIEDLKKGLYPGETRTASQIQKENKKVITQKLKIKFDVWFSEKSLYTKKEVEKALNYLKKKGLTYEKEGALWFKSTKFGDDKDRVLIRENGETTYFASDVVYLKNKFSRGFKKLIFLLGADHFGYLQRMKGVAEALGYKKEQLDFIFFQLVRLFDGKKEVRMSKRMGQYIAIEEVVDEVGLDATRYFFISRGNDSHLNFDLKLAKEKSQKNPVYYIQYAYARMSSILRKAKTSSLKFNLLKEESELDLIKQILKLEEVIENTVKDYQVQRIPQYANDLAESFHRFYHNCQVIGDDKELTSARLSLVKASQKTLKQTLDLMGISAPEKM